VGRTARAGNSGIALTVYETSDEDALNRLEKMGIQFKHVDLKNNEFVSVDDRNKRKTRIRQEDKADVIAKSMVQKPTKVKPGYKKKMQGEMDKIKKRHRKIEQRKK
ncbi:MAG: DEAD/DEAH box helicase, partial [Bacillus sp. (in: Bacteria)]|nr:DEAD/DEAH box helicase [Bacillus sp. (in: firmicutes)]